MEQKNLITKIQSNKNIVLFLVKFFAIFFILSSIVEFANLSFLTNFLAFITSSYAGLSFLGNQIFFNNQVFVVTNSCTGLVSASILAAVIFALSKPDLFKKLKLFVFGALLLLVINVLRILLVLFVAKLGLMDVDLVHTFTWFIMSAIILLVWYYGTKVITKIRDFSGLV